MKKFLALLLALIMVLAVFTACSGGGGEEGGEPGNEGGEVVDGNEVNEGGEGGEAGEAAIAKVALVTDVGTIDDESFNQACWQGVESWCTANNVEYTYYQPSEDSTDARLLSIAQAVSEGANVIVMPGYLFGESVISAQEDYPEVYFLAIDVGSGDLTYDYVTFYEPAANTVCITFAEEQAGYLAGYAAVKDGYTKLGFLGGMAVPAVIRYGYGFVQGADAAAQELGVDIQINYTYGGQFFGDASITAKMEGWYSTGTEIVFACGGGIYTSAVEAAIQYDGMVIGVDVDQHYIGDAVNEDGTPKYEYNMFLTSAMKGLQNVTESALEALNTGNWADYSGKFLVLSLNEGDYVGLPTAETSWEFKTFTLDEYNAVLASIKDGTVTVDNGIEAMPAVSDHTTVTEIA